MRSTFKPFICPNCHVPVPDGLIQKHFLDERERLTAHVVRLSPREKEILSHLFAGRSNKLIARKLGITEATVKVHLKSVLRKIGVANRTQAAIWALANLPELDVTPNDFV